MSREVEALERIAAALERISPPGAALPDFAAADAYMWAAEPDRLVPVPKVHRVDMELLVGIDRARDTLMENTLRFARGLPANNALLWGARGMGKSSLVKAVHAAVGAEQPGGLPGGLVLIEVHREDVGSLPRLLAGLRGSARRFILFCDEQQTYPAGDHFIIDLLDVCIAGSRKRSNMIEVSHHRKCGVFEFNSNRPATPVMCNQGSGR